jgi:hypothetical protein
MEMRIKEHVLSLLTVGVQEKDTTVAQPRLSNLQFYAVTPQSTPTLHSNQTGKPHQKQSSVA